MKIGVLIAALAGGIVMFLLGFLFFGLVFAEFFRTNMVQYPGLQKDPPIVWAIFLFNFAWAWLITWVIDRVGKGGWAEGAKAGAIVMFIIALAANLDFYAFLNVHKGLSPMLLHILIVTFTGMVAGAAIGLLLGYFGRSRTTA